MNENIEFAKPNTTGRFEIRKTDYAIIDTTGDMAPIMVEMDSPEDGSDSQYADIAGVMGLLNRLDNAASNKQVSGNVTDGLLFLEENIIILEKIMKDIDYIGRRNFKQSNEFNRQREERYLIGITNHYERIFQDSYKMIRQIKDGLKE